MNNQTEPSYHEALDSLHASRSMQYAFAVALLGLPVVRPFTLILLGVSIIYLSELCGAQLGKNLRSFPRRRRETFQLLETTTFVFGMLFTVASLDPAIGIQGWTIAILFFAVSAIVRSAKLYAELWPLSDAQLGRRLRKPPPR